MKKLYPEFFRRVDEEPDALFYAQPRRVKHMDEAAARAAKALYCEVLPPKLPVLDLMASYHSHLPASVGPVTGLGLNKAELEDNEAVADVVVQDLNRDAHLPFGDAQFGGCVCTVSVQYMTRPDELFPEVARVLQPGAPFIVTFSNRMFPTKAILAWRSSDDEAHIRLVETYFSLADFGETKSLYHTPEGGDPLYGVWAHKTAERPFLN